MKFTRYRADGSRIGSYESLYILTKDDGAGASNCVPALQSEMHYGILSRGSSCLARSNAFRASAFRPFFRSASPSW